MKTEIKNQAGFTLVELLGVIAIIGLLVVLVAPAINSALGQSRTTKATTNLRQIGRGMFEFLGDNKWIYPVRLGDSAAYGHGSQVHWQEQMNSYVTDPASHNPNSKYNHRRNPIWRSPNAKPTGDHHFGLNHNMTRPEWSYQYRAIPNPGQIVIVGEVNVNSSLFRPDVDPVFNGRTETTYRISNPGDTALYLFADLRVEALQGDQGENVSGNNLRMYRWW